MTGAVCTIEIPIGSADECFVGLDNDYDAKECPTGMTKCLVVYESSKHQFFNNQSLIVIY